MVEHDGHVGQVLAKLKELGLEDNTIVMYSTDNGAEKAAGPMAAPRCSAARRTRNWEGGYRVPTASSAGPASSSPARCINDIVAHEDMLPTLLAAAGAPDVKEDLLKGMKVGDKTYKVHLDGYNLTDALAGKSPSPRQEFIYLTDDGSSSRCATTTGRSSSRAARPRLRCLAGAFREPACSHADQPAHRSRSRPPIRRAWTGTMVCRAHVPVGPGAGYVGQVAAEVPRIPAPPEAGSFNLDQRNGSGDERRRATSDAALIGDCFPQYQRAASSARRLRLVCVSVPTIE